MSNNGSLLAIVLLVPFALIGCAPAGPSVGTATLGDVHIHYTDHPGPRRSDRALILVHGWSCDESVWRYQIEAFTGRARVITLDLPGSGKSDKPRINYSMDLFAESIAAVCEDAGIDWLACHTSDPLRDILIDYLLKRARMY